MIPMASDTMTLYMRHVSNHKDVWIRAVFAGGVWSQKTVRDVDTNGNAKLTRETVVLIPAEIVALIGTGAAFYVSPKAYATLTDVQRATAWTLDKGCVIIRGAGSDITDSYTLADLKSSNDTYATVQVIYDNTNRPVLKHWQIEAV
jgi:hypothetical protein